MNGLSKELRHNIMKDELKEYISIPAKKGILKEIMLQEKERHISVMTPHRRITQVVPWIGLTNSFACLEEVPVDYTD